MISAAEEIVGALDASPSDEACEVAGDGAHLPGDRRGR